MAFAETAVIIGFAGLLAGLKLLAGVGLIGKIGAGNKGLLDLISDISAVRSSRSTRLSGQYDGRYGSSFGKRTCKFGTGKCSDEFSGRYI